MDEMEISRHLGGFRYFKCFVGGSGSAFDMKDLYMSLLLSRFS